MRRWKTTLGASVFALILAFAGTFSALAETEVNKANDSETTDTAYEMEMPDPEVLQADIALCHWGTSMTATMQARAFQLAEEEEDNTRKSHFKDMATVRTLDPVRFLVMDLTPEQADQLKETLHIDGMKDAALVVGNLLNRGYEEYAECAYAASATRELYPMDLTAEYGGDDRSPFVGFLTFNERLNVRYNSHIVIFTGDNDGIGACFVISSAESAMNMDASYIMEYTSLLGLSDLDIRLYTGDALSWMMGWNEENPYPVDLATNWGDSYAPAAVNLVETLAYSPELLKLICGLNVEGIDCRTFWVQGASDRMRLVEKSLSEARFISGELFQQVRYEEDGEAAVMDFLSRNEDVLLDQYRIGEQPAVIGSLGWSAEGDNLDVLPEGAKVLIVFHRFAEDAVNVTGIDWRLQAAVPISHMPETPDDVDYIIYCDVTYEGDKYVQGNLELIYPYSHITIHDAQSGKIVKDLGTVERCLESHELVARTITYWTPSTLQTWEAIRSVFPVPEEEETGAQSSNTIFTYIHDPRENPEAMADIVENPDAVYGFSPDPESKRLGAYAEYDWTDPQLVAQAKEERRAYHESMVSMTDILYRMRDEGASIEEMARAVSEERNRLRLASYDGDPEGLAAVKKSNLETYGQEEGPTPDQLFEKYGSWTAVMQKAFSPNMGMDACCGLYDEYYWLYIELGYVE